MSRRSRLETRQCRWWARVDDFCLKNDISEHSRDDLFMIVLEAIDEDAASALGANGGLRGGKARAAAMSPEQRSEAAKRAALARWKRPAS